VSIYKRPESSRYVVEIRWRCAPGLGHSTPAMTLRYMMHAPENYFGEDAARVGASLSEATDREPGAHADLARQGLKRS